MCLKKRVNVCREMEREKKRKVTCFAENDIILSSIILQLNMFSCYCKSGYFLSWLSTRFLLSNNTLVYYIRGYVINHSNVFHILPYAWG